MGAIYRFSAGDSQLVIDAGERITTVSAGKKLTCVSKLANRVIAQYAIEASSKSLFSN